MKISFYKLMSLFMAGLLLLTTTSFSIEAHYCGDSLVDVAVFEEAQSCGMQSADPAMQDLVKNMECCHDKLIVSEGDDSLQKTSNDHSLDQLVFISAFMHSYASRFDLALENRSTSIIKEAPPLIGRELFLLHDSFLI